MMITVPVEALKIQEELLDKISKNDNDDYKNALKELNVCINAIKALGSRRHLEVLLPRAVKKARLVLNKKIYHS